MEPAYGTPPGPERREGDGEWSVEERLRNQAVRNLRRRAAFRVHLLVFALVNLLLVVIWLVSGITAGGAAWYPWWVFPFFGWGIGLVMHGWSVHRGDELTESRIREEMNRIAGQ
jgi:2TM domain